MTFSKATTPTYSTTTTPSPISEPVETPQKTPEYVIPEKNLKTIANIRNELINILVSVKIREITRGVPEPK